MHLHFLNEFTIDSLFLYSRFLFFIDPATNKSEQDIFDSIFDGSQYPSKHSIKSDKPANNTVNKKEDCLLHHTHTLTNATEWSKHVPHPAAVTSLQPKTFGCPSPLHAVRMSAEVQLAPVKRWAG